MMRKKPLSKDEHRLHGAELDFIHQYLTTFYVLAANRYGKTKPAPRAANKALAAIDSLRCVLDNQAVSDAVQAKEELPHTGPSPYYPGTPCPPASMDIVGKWFHSYNDERKVEWQGHVIGRPSLGVYVVQLFSWITTEATDQKLVRLLDMWGWSFYDTSEQMNARYEILVLQGRAG